MKANKFIGMIQPKTAKNFEDTKLPTLHNVGCLENNFLRKLKMEDI